MAVTVIRPRGNADITHSEGVTVSVAEGHLLVHSQGSLGIPSVVVGAYAPGSWTRAYAGETPKVGTEQGEGGGARAV